MSIEVKFKEIRKGQKWKFRGGQVWTILKLAREGAILLSENGCDKLAMSVEETIQELMRATLLNGPEGVTLKVGDTYRSKHDGKVVRIKAIAEDLVDLGDFETDFLHFFQNFEPYVPEITVYYDPVEAYIYAHEAGKLRNLTLGITVIGAEVQKVIEDCVAIGVMPKVGDVFQHQALPFTVMRIEGDKVFLKALDEREVSLYRLLTTNYTKREPVSDPARPSLTPQVGEEYACKCCGEEATVAKVGKRKVTLNYKGEAVKVPLDAFAKHFTWVQ